MPDVYCRPYFDAIDRFLGIASFSWGGLTPPTLFYGERLHAKLKKDCR